MRVRGAVAAVLAFVLAFASPASAFAWSIHNPQHWINTGLRVEGNYSAWTWELLGVEESEQWFDGSFVFPGGLRFGGGYIRDSFQSGFVGPDISDQGWMRTTPLPSSVTGTYTAVAYGSVLLKVGRPEDNQDDWTLVNGPPVVGLGKDGLGLKVAQGESGDFYRDPWNNAAGWWYRPVGFDHATLESHATTLSEWHKPTDASIRLVITAIPRPDKRFDVYYSGSVAINGTSNWAAAAVWNGVDGSNGALDLRRYTPYADPCGVVLITNGVPRRAAWGRIAATGSFASAESTSDAAALAAKELHDNFGIVGNWGDQTDPPVPPGIDTSSTLNGLDGTMTPPPTSLDPAAWKDWLSKVLNGIGNVFWFMGIWKGWDR